MHARQYLKAVIHAGLGVCKHETEAKILLVWKVLSVESDAAVELAHTFVDLTVLLEELQLHGVTLCVVDSARRDHVVDLDISRGIRLGSGLSSLSSVFLHETRDTDFGQLSDHSCDFCLIFKFIFDRLDFKNPSPFKSFGSQIFKAAHSNLMLCCPFTYIYLPYSLFYYSFLY